VLQLVRTLSSSVDQRTPVNHSSTSVSDHIPTRSLVLPARVASSSVLVVADAPRVSEFKHFRFLVHLLDWRIEDRGVKCTEKIMNQCHQMSSLIIEPHIIYFLFASCVSYDQIAKVTWLGKSLFDISIFDHAMSPSLNPILIPNTFN